MSQITDAYRQAANNCRDDAVALVVYHRTGAAVVEQLNRASLASPFMRAPFEPKVGRLLTVWHRFLRFLDGKTSFQQLLVLDTVIPQSGVQIALDAVVRHLGFEVDANRQVQGSRARLVGRTFAILFTAIVFPIFRFAPEIMKHPVIQESHVLEWFYDNVIQTWWVLMAAPMLVAVVLGLLEWRANLLGLFKKKPELTTPDEEVKFIVDEVRKRQGRSLGWLVIELPLMYLLTPLFLVLHGIWAVARFVIWWRLPPDDAGCDSDVRRRLLSRLRRNALWFVGNLTIILSFLFGSGLLGGLAAPSRPTGPGTFWGGIFLSSAVFVGIAAVREIIKLFRPSRLSVTARDWRTPLLVASGLAVLMLLGGIGTWLYYVEALRPFVGPFRLLTGAALIVAWVRCFTHSLKWVLVRICDIQRLGTDFPRFYDGLRNAIHYHLLVVGLWNTDEAAEVPTGFLTVHAPLDEARDVEPRLRRLFPPRFEPDLEPQLHRLAEYLVKVSRGLHEPIVWFEDRITSRGRWRYDFLRVFYNAVPTILDMRLPAYPDQSAEARPEPLRDWQRGFQAVRKQLRSEWKANRLEGLPADSHKTGAMIRQLVDLVQEWETDTRRFHLDVLARRYESRLPDYSVHLVRLALFLDLDAADYLALEDWRAQRWDEVRSPNRPEPGVPLSLCLEAGLFPGLSAGQAGRYLESYRREGFLQPVDPIIFRPTEWSFLATAFLPTAQLYAEHEVILAQLVQAGRSDARFLKVAAAYARRIQQQDYQARLPQPDQQPDSEASAGAEAIADAPGTSYVIGALARLRLLFHSTGSLFDYYERLSHEGLAGVQAERLLRELRQLEHPAEDFTDALSITTQLRKIERRIHELPASHADKERYERLLDDLEERWRRLRIRRLLLDGSFAVDQDPLGDPSLPVGRTELGALLHETATRRRPDGAVCYNQRAAHNHYTLGRINLECDRPLMALAQFAASAGTAFQRDDALYVKSQLHAVRSLAAMDLHGWAAEVLERLHEEYTVFLGDDPTLHAVRLVKGRSEAHLRAHSPSFNWAVLTRWLAPVQQRAALGVPVWLQARLDQALALYEEKRGDAERALVALRAAHSLLRTTPVRRWQLIQTQVDLARLARRHGLAHEVQHLLDRDTLQGMVRYSRRGCLEVCHTLARESQSRANYTTATPRYHRLLQVALNEDASALGDLYDEHDLDAKETPPLEMVEAVGQLLDRVQPRAGRHVPWTKVLQATFELSDVFRVRATAHQLGQLTSAERRRAMQDHWVAAHRLLRQSYTAFRRYLDEAHGVALLPEGVAAKTGISRVLFLDKSVVGRRDVGLLRLLDERFGVAADQRAGEAAKNGLSLADAYLDLTTNGQGELVERLAPPLRQLLYQLYLASECVQLGMTLFLPEVRGEASEDWGPVPRNGEWALRSGEPNLTRYLEFLERFRAERQSSPDSPARLAGVNSATLRTVCEFSRLFLLQQCFVGLTSGMEELLRAWAEKHVHGGHKGAALPVCEDPQVPATAYLLVLWEHVGSLDRLRMMFRGLLDRLQDPQTPLPVSDVERERARVSLQRLFEEQLGDARTAERAAENGKVMVNPEIIEHRLHRVLTQLLQHVPHSGDQRPHPEAYRTVRFLLLRPEARDSAARLVPFYEEALTALLTYPENDLFESLLNRITLLEGLRDASLFFSESKRELFASRVIHAWVEQLFCDLDRLNNHYLTAYVRRSFFPHWGEVN